VPDPSDPGPVETELLARHAAVPGDPDPSVGSAVLPQGLRGALDLEHVVAQAVGVVVAQQRCTPDEAFGLLQRASQRVNRELAELATLIVGQAIDRRAVPRSELVRHLLTDRTAIDPSGERPAEPTQVLQDLLQESHVMEPGQIEALAARAAQLLGAADAFAYLVDPHQRELVALSDRPGAPSRLAIEGSLAGRAFIAGRVFEQEEAGTRILWLPLLDGSERLGVLGVAASGDRLDQRLRTATAALASLTAELLVSKNQYTDVYRTAVRDRPMSLAAEIQWGLLPPLTLTTRRVAVSGVVEPAYDIGGDVFDYALNGDEVHLGIFDAVGHGLTAAWPAVLAISSVRRSRRLGLGLAASYAAADEVLRSGMPDGCFVTGHLAHLDLPTARLRWISSGHPPPLLVRNRRVVASLPSAPSLPLGLGGEVVGVAEASLEPGDRVIFFTDGVVEGRRRGEAAFGLDRFADVIQRESLAGTGPAETMRRLSHAVLDHYAHELTDDFTMLLVEYRGRVP
jgi:serine phosphatase RsbU (regulator of sigma subunit)